MELVNDRQAHAALALVWCWFGGVLPLAAQEGPTWRISSVPEVEIGAITGKDAYLFQSIWSGRFLPDGRIAVADAGRDVVRIYGPDGAFHTEIGGSGEGPGEFRTIMGMWLTPDGRIAVWDAGTLRFTILSTEGEVRETSRVRVEGEVQRTFGNLEVFLGSFEDGDALLAGMRAGVGAGDDGAVPDVWFLGRFGLDGELEERLGELRGMRRINRRPIPFSPMPHVAVAEDSILVLDGFGSEIRVLDSTGGRVRAIAFPRKQLAPDDPSSTLVKELRRRDTNMANALLSHLEHGRMPEVDDRFPQISDLLIDDRGYLWIKTFEIPDDSIWLRKKGATWPAPGGEWRIISREGELLATVRMPGEVIPLEIRGNRLLGLAMDRDLGVERLVVHAIER